MRSDKTLFYEGFIRSFLKAGLIIVLSSTSAFSMQNLQPPQNDPTITFADSVEILETIPLLIRENETRLLWYFSPETMTWQSYPYPETIGDIDGLMRRNDGTWLIADTRSYPAIPIPQLDPQHVWLFSPQSGAITRPSTRCNRIQALPNEGEWILQSEDNLLRFCNTETGELSDFLPAQLGLDAKCTSEFYGNTSATSPDSQWVVFHNCGRPFTLYSYQVTTGQIKRLGQTDERLNALGIFEWLGETTINIVGDTGLSSDLVRFYIADITTSESLVFVANSPQILRNPLRYTWDGIQQAQTTTGEWLPDVWLDVYEYNLNTTSQTQLMHYRCGDDIYNCYSGLSLPNPNNTLIAIADNPPNRLGTGLLVYDLIAEQLVYANANAHVPNSDMGWANVDTLVYIDKQPFVTQLHTVNFGKDDLTETTFDIGPTSRIHFLSPDGRYFIIFPPNEISLYSIDTGVVIPIAHSPNGDFWGHWDENGLLGVSLNCCSGLSSRRWLVHIPDGNNIP